MDPRPIVTTPSVCDNWGVDDLYEERYYHGINRGSIPFSEEGYGDKEEEEEEEEKNGRRRWRGPVDLVWTGQQ